MNFAGVHVDITTLLQAVFGGVLAASGVYAAIRADLARTNERATQALARADDAHERIDSMLMKG